MNYPHKTWLWLNQLVFPYRCLCCRQYLDAGYLCKKCFNELPVKKSGECVGCKLATPDGRTCAFCRETNPLDRLLVVSDFKDPHVAMLVKRMKYSFIRELIDPFHELTRKYLALRAKRGASFLEGNPLLVAVPLHARRENWRGFNQSALLTERLARSFNMQSAVVLVRTGESKPQADIEDRESRIQNAKGLYEYISTDVVVGRNIVLIDDVCTTGATLNECARVLKNAGAHSVSALVLARG